ncbi:glutathione S-transferase family protein [Reinekea blandensis]|uniref:Glutathione S-transferase family protein n=1 Tax=Reinekea blandensis MED297 TaxID=314283 RepID=A4BI61_9GAMM|nr:glutathione S-transferase family protein [Reinekea blandensis]EAR08204.1 glutathione S-transferase family protein [Reinekea sp. MED297] [Reinekea blandensis MED297]
MTRTLFTGNRNASSWAFRAWLALKEVNIAFREECIDIRRPQRWDNLQRIGRFSPPAAVPVLDDNGFIIWDSLAIMEYANDLSDGQLMPTDLQQRAKARAFVSWQHSTFARVCPALSFESTFYPNKKTLSWVEREDILEIYDLWESTISTFDGPYLIGHYSLADIMLLPSVLRFSSHLPVDHRHPGVRNWIEQLLNRPHVTEWLSEAYEQEPIYLPGYRDAG